MEAETWAAMLEVEPMKRCADSEEMQLFDGKVARSWWCAHRCAVASTAVKWLCWIVVLLLGCWGNVIWTGFGDARGVFDAGEE